MKAFLKEFKEFAMQGNVMDMAVGVVIGGAFKAIIDSLVGDIINPVVGLFAGKDFTDLVVKIGGCTIKYGSFITAVINFIIMAFVIFCVVKAMNKAKNFRKKPEAPAAPTEKECPFCKNKIPVAATRCGFCTSVLDDKI